MRQIIMTIVGRYLMAAAALLMLVVAAPGQIETQAQTTSCPVFIEQALDFLENNCEAMGRNSACYGYSRVDATFAQEVEPAFFSQPADRTALIDLETIRTTPLNLALDRWGIAVMNVQANVPNTLPGQAVTFLLLGDAQLENRVAPEEAHIPPDPVSVRVRGGANVNLRSGPGTASNIVDIVSPGTELLADAVNDGRDWLRVLYEDAPAWISLPLVDAADAAALAALPSASASAFTPMQAFHFRTGIGHPDCVEAPDSLVVQGPQQFAVDLNVNGAQVTIGSTVVLSSPDPDAGAVIDFESPFGPGAIDLLIGGHFYIYAGDEDYAVIAGGAPPGGGLPLTADLFLNPVDGQTLLLTTSFADTTGLNIAGGAHINPAAAAVVTGTTPPDSYDGIAVSGRLYLTPVDGAVILSIEPSAEQSSVFRAYRRLSPDEEPLLLPLDDADPQMLMDNPLAGAQPLNDRAPLLSGSPSPGNSPGCRLTEIVVLDGQALLNDGALIVPIGHAADTETCFGADGQVESQSGWDNLRALEPDELQERFGLLARMPPRLLRYPIRIPTREDMLRAQATPTPHPAAPAPPPDEPRPPTTLGVDCSAFRSTSPSDGLAFGPQQFFWDAAPGAERYRVVVRATDRPGQVSGEANAPATNLTLDLGLGALSQFGRGLNFEYQVLALAAIDGSLQVACESQVRFLNREFISAERLCVMLEGQMGDDNLCYTREGPITIPD
jgi:hypothetical protein